MSSCAHATVAANRAVAAPTTAMMVITLWESSRMGLMRTIRNTPAVTMVAAWMSADTGVGPSMASGSHTYSGIWADLHTAPQNKRSGIAVAQKCGAGWAA